MRLGWHEGRAKEVMVMCTQCTTPSEHRHVTLCHCIYSCIELHSQHHSCDWRHENNGFPSVSLTGFHDQLRQISPLTLFPLLAFQTDRHSPLSCTILTIIRSSHNQHYIFFNLSSFARARDNVTKSYTTQHKIHI